jgi:predicted secreted hydrolase
MNRLGILALSSLGFVACGGGSSRPVAAPAPPAAGRLSLPALLSDTSGQGSDDGFQRALAPRPFVFPDDDGPHPGFRSEWWYFTGVLRAPDAGGAERRFGYEMTIFRQALAPRLPARASAWATRDVYMGHFTISDVDGAGGARRFHAYERFARDGLALAGGRARPFAVWVDDWRMQGPDAVDRSMPAHLSARDDDGAAIDLDVGVFADGADRASAGQPIAEGDRGRSVKGPAPGNASFYYSRTSLPTRGRLTLPSTGATATSRARASFAVSGSSWMDREWSTGSLGAGVRGWDWLGVHLSDGRDLMMYRLRDAADDTTSASRVTLIAAPAASSSRAVRSYTADRFVLTPLDFWTSPQSGARYPVSFQLDIPDEGIRLVIRPLLADQELPLAVVYWEGAVSLAGTADGAAITGEGYLELTGYGGGQRQR